MTLKYVSTEPQPIPLGLIKKITYCQKHLTHLPYDYKCEGFPLAFHPPSWCNDFLSKANVMWLEAWLTSNGCSYDWKALGHSILEQGFVLVVNPQTPIQILIRLNKIQKEFQEYPVYDDEFYYSRLDNAYRKFWYHEGKAQLRAEFPVAEPLQKALLDLWSDFEHTWSNLEHPNPEPCSHEYESYSLNLTTFKEIYHKELKALTEISDFREKV
jgi:hypothetical protein